MRTGQDILQRFTPTPLAADLRAAGRAIRLRTNSPVILHLVRSALDRYDGAAAHNEPFLWTVIADNDSGLHPPWPDSSHVSSDGLFLLNMGQRSFSALDAQERNAIGFVAEDLLNDVLGFEEFFLAPLFSVTAGALGLTPLSASCLARGNQCLLILGPRKSGKTTLCYAASKAGFQLHSDQVVFLDTNQGRLQTWGDFWPIVFYPEAAQVFSEIAAMTQAVRRKEASILCLERNKLGLSQLRSAHPLGSVFLDGQTSGDPALKPLAREECEAMLKEKCLFKDGAEPRGEFAGALRILGKLPAYRVACGAEPASSVEAIRSLFEKVARLAPR